MKKLLSVFLVVLMLTCSIGMGQISADSQVIKGDANSDGVVDAKDVLLIMRHYVGHNDKINLEAADYNSDSKVNSKDVLLVTQHITYIPKDYKNTLTDSAQVNQVGYETSSTKTVKLSESSDIGSSNSKISQVECYLVNTSNNKAVYQDKSTKRVYDSITEKYVSTFDFSAIKTAGTYKVYTPSGYSYSFEIKDNPYKDVQQALITALYYNRCGEALTSNMVGKFSHDVCHDGDVPVYILNKYDESKGKYVQSSVAKASDFSGGLHDAGDYGRYTTPACQVVADLLMTYEMYGSAADCTKISSSSDLLAEAKYEMEWLLKMQNKDSGGVYWRISTLEFVSYGQAPDKDTYFKNTGLYVSHETLKSTAAFVGAAAMCARVYKDSDPQFATKCLNAAKSAYGYVKANMNDPNAHKAFENDSESPQGKSGEYGDDSAWAEIWWAACELFRTTGDSAYNADVKDLYDKKNNGKLYFTVTDITCYNMGGAGSFAYLNASKADSELRSSVLAELTTVADNGKKISKKNNMYNLTLKTQSDYQWGSNFRACLALKDMAIVDYVNKTSEYDETIRDGISYLLGRNVVNYSFITGFGSNPAKNIWHNHSISCNSTPAGFMVGGTYLNGYNYQDIREYHMNEVAINWNAAAIMVFGYAVSADSK